jgi:hypothetical protein
MIDEEIIDVKITEQKEDDIKRQWSYIYGASIVLFILFGFITVCVVSSLYVTNFFIILELYIFIILILFTIIYYLKMSPAPPPQTPPEEERKITAKTYFICLLILSVLLFAVIIITLLFVTSDRQHYNQFNYEIKLMIGIFTIVTILGVGSFILIYLKTSPQSTVKSSS